MNTKEISQTIYLFSSQHEKELAKVATKYNLTQIEVNILLFIYNNPTLNTSSDIVYYRRIAKSFVSKGLDLLIEKDLIIINKDKLDKRITRISLTNKAIPICSDAKKIQTLFFNNTFKNINKEEIETFENIFNKIHNNLKEN